MEFGFTTSHFGDRVAKARRAIYAWKPAEVHWSEKELKATARQAERKEAEALWPVLLPCEAIGKERWIPDADYALMLDTGIGTTGDRRLLWPVGKLKNKENGSIHLVHGPKGFGATPRAKPAEVTGYRGILIFDERSEAGFPVRSLEPLEVWLAAGGTKEEWLRCLGGGALTIEDLMEAAATWTTPGAVGALIQPFLHRQETRGTHTEPSSEGRAGVGLDLEDEGMKQALRVWLAAWARMPQDPRWEYVEWLEGRKQGCRRAGGLRDRRVSIPDAHQLVSFATPKPGAMDVSESAERGEVVKPTIGHGRYAEEREDLRIGFALARLAKRTRSGYEVAWRHWTWFLKARGRDPFFLGRDSQERRADEEVLLDFIVHLAHYVFQASRRHRQGQALRDQVLPPVGGLGGPLQGQGQDLAGTRRDQGDAGRHEQEVPCHHLHAEVVRGSARRGHPRQRRQVGVHLGGLHVLAPSRRVSWRWTSPLCRPEGL